MLAASLTCGQHDESKFYAHPSNIYRSPPVKEKRVIKASKPHEYLPKAPSLNPLTIFLTVFQQHRN